MIIENIFTGPNIYSESLQDSVTIYVESISGRVGDTGATGATGPQGPKGDTGDSGSGGGAQNTFIQQTDPALAIPYQWWQVDGSGNLVTLWVKS